MKTLSVLPEIEEKMISGTLNQATVSKAIQFLNKEAKLESREIPLAEKRELFAKIENLTERQVERELSIISPEAAVPDRVKQISLDGYRRQLTTDQAFEDKLARLKEILAHSFKGGNPTDCEILNIIADIALEQLDPIKKDERKQKRDELKNSKAEKSESASKNQEGQRNFRSHLVKDRVTNREVLTAQMKRVVRKIYDYKCGYTNPITKGRCNNRFATQFDHITPVALGGETVIENLRLVCRTHNQHYAIQKLGRQKMSRYLKSLN